MSPGRKALFLNWRDPWHPRSGGAELVTLRVAERLVSRGWSVEWFSSAYEGAPAKETRSGIDFIRSGSAATVHLEAFRRYARTITADFHVAVDQINTIPFLTPLYLRIPKVAFVHQLAREVWFYESRFPVSALGYAAEPVYLQAYRRTPIITVSKSSASSLTALGLRGPMHIIPEAVDEPLDVVVPPRGADIDIVVVGRVTPSKRIEFSIAAAELLKTRGWRGTLHIVGAGEPDYVRRLSNLADVRLGAQVRFHGKVGDAERTALLREASVLWMTSVREGWGLVVTEAARHGTPAVVFDVPGLRDSVRHGVTGFVAEPSARALAESTRQLLDDWSAFATRALADSATYDWDTTTTAFESVLLRYAHRNLSDSTTPDAASR